MMPRQKIGLAILALLATAVWAVMFFVPRHALRPITPTQQDSLFSLADSLNRSARPNWQRNTIAIQRRPFNPNTADSLTLLHLGLRPWQVHNMLRYRAHGGRFRTPKDLLKLYGMNDSLYALLEPYIILPAPDTLYTASDSLPHSRHTLPDTIVELNSADTAALIRIRGIGPYMARRILARRDSLGGYVSVQQLREIRGLNPYGDSARVPLDTVLAQLTVCPDSVHPLPVNRASVQRLMRHPYLRFEQARDLYELRRNRIRLSSVEDLLTLHSFTPEDINRLTPYLSFTP